MIESSAAAEAAFARNPLAAGLDRPPAAGTVQNAAQIRAAAHEFEAVFLSQMLGHMFSGIETDGLFGGGRSEEMFRSLMINEYGRQISEAGGIGIADAVMAEMLRIQEGSSS
ncbi:MAG: chemotactic signal-response protein chel [Alphaproteobacteria bacterium]|jgi:Rod binding domain-containing protein|nr:chemotactic signal-response protein chel [Alphaproteobacteria bacterium]